MATSEAEVGASRAARHADRVIDRWSDRAYKMLLDYRLVVDRKPFMTEDLREVAEKSGLDAPPDKRAWGAVIIRAHRAKVIELHGFAPVKDRRSHGGPKYVWRFVF